MAKKKLINRPRHFDDVDGAVNDLFAAQVNLVQRLLDRDYVYECFDRDHGIWRDKKSCDRQEGLTRSVSASMIKKEILFKYKQVVGIEAIEYAKCDWQPPLFSTLVLGDQMQHAIAAEEYELAGELKAQIEAQIEVSRNKYSDKV